MRHEPDESAAALYRTLGAKWVVADDAPPCVRACGRPECRRTVADLRALREEIDRVTRKRGLPRIRLEVEEDWSLIPAAPEATATTNGSAPAVPCRTEGCENAANTRYDRGPYSRLCDEVCIPARRVELGRTLSAVAARRRAAPPTEYPPRGIADPPAPEALDLAALEEPPEPTEEEPPERHDVTARDPWEVLDELPEPAAATTTLADLADALERAREARDDAESAYEEAVERFLSHPIVRELDVGYRPSD